MKLCVVYGCRPEAIKLSPVVQELRRRGIQPTILSTGQHTTLLRGTPAETVLTSDVSLGLASDNDPLQYANTCDGALRARWVHDRPDVVIVQGDTASAYAGAMAASALEIPVAHVEAGIRTGNVDDPWPEEQFRVQIDHVTTHYFFPTLHTYRNLTDEPQDSFPLYAAGKVTTGFITGNPGIDALYAEVRPTTAVDPVVLVTLHRRESFGAPLDRLVAGLCEAARRHPRLGFWWPTHPNPRVQAALPNIVPENLHFVAPWDHNGFAWQLCMARAVITDSGGVQEEAAALGVPCVVARDVTDRPESVDAGLARVAGRAAEGILEGLEWALGFTQRPDPSFCFGDGHAAPRIVDHLSRCVSR